MGGALMKNVEAADISGRLANQTDEVENDDVFDLQVPASIKNVFIEGLSKTKNELVTSQLERLFKVTTFDSVLTQSHLCKLKLERLGIFSSIEVFVDVSDNSSENNFDVYYFVKEQRRLSANAGTNVGHNEGNMTLGARINNLNGSGGSVKANASFGTRVSSAYEFSFSKPFQCDPDKKFTIRALKSMSDLVQSEYKESTKGFALESTYPSILGLHTLTWDYLWRENLINMNAPFDVRQHAGHSLKSAVRHSLVSDGRNDWIFPSNGHLFKHTLEYGGIGGNVKLFKTDLEIQLNKEIFTDIVFAASLNAGMAKSLTCDPLLLNDRCFVGGPLSVRGFAMKGIGTHANQAAMGGELYLTSGLHVYTPLPFRLGRGGLGDLFRIHFFANTGNISRIRDLDVNDFLLKPRYSCGLGLMLMLGGMARLEVNYCIPKNARPGDIINEGLQVGVGINFL